MSNAVNAADTLVLSVSEVKRQQVNLQRDHIKNENRVNYATEAAMKAKAKADNANTELYHLNKGIYKTISWLLLRTEYRSESEMAFLKNYNAVCFLIFDRKS